MHYLCVSNLHRCSSKLLQSYQCEHCYQVCHVNYKCTIACSTEARLQIHVVQAYSCNKTIAFSQYDGICIGSNNANNIPCNECNQISIASQLSAAKSLFLPGHGIVDEQGKFPIHYAAESGTVSVLTTLLEKEAQFPKGATMVTPVKDDILKDTPVHLAAQHGHAM